MTSEELLLRLKPINILRWGKCELRKIKFHIGLIKRSLHDDGRYDKLRALKNIHDGERCFIICTGPSLTLDDVLLLRNEFTIGMNSICKLFTKTNWRPSMYGIQDLLVYDRLKDDLKNLKSDTICVIGNNIAAERELDAKWIPFPLYVAYHDFDKTVFNRFYAKFSGDCSRVVYDGYSITFSLLQIAVYMGFKDVYLLGADCSFSNTGKNHFMEHGHQDAQINTAQARNFAMYECAKTYCNKNEINIYNATRGGELEIFPRINFDEFISRL